MVPGGFFILAKPDGGTCDPMIVRYREVWILPKTLHVSEFVTPSLL